MVFISYCRKDEDYINPFIRELEKHHFNIWDYRQRIIGNADEERNQVKQAIIDCDVIFAFLSNNYFDSINCMEEWMFADLQQKIVQPFIMDNCEIPDDKEFDKVRKAVKEKVDTKKTTPEKLAWSILNNKKYADFRNRLDSVNEFYRKRLENTSFLTLKKPSLLPQKVERDTFSYYDTPPKFVTFNSHIDHPKFGDEREFLFIREAGSVDWHRSMLIEPGKKYEVQIAYHNNADPALNPTGKTIADDVVLQVEMPDIALPNAWRQIKTTIACPTAKPPFVSDFIDVYSNENAILLSHVTASARINNTGKTNGQCLSTNLFASGILLGYNKLDGRLPAGDDWAGYVTFEFDAIMPHCKRVLRREASCNGKPFSNNPLHVKPGDTISFSTFFKNDANVNRPDVCVMDKLNGPFQLVSDSTFVVDSVGNRQHLYSGNIDKNGYNLGTFGEGVSCSVNYDVKVSEDAKPGSYITTSHEFDQTGHASSDQIIIVD